eukprot:TRINITY_DN417_c0_g1_i1.p1 TRINITY_DN417_c0_g1~~TRINITY_DN417_c0_g1_i1.p1  ORF type:complete len:341 (-),score=86.62 TRINITY_DN417_c0_g1_i1:139-1161(-)
MIKKEEKGSRFFRFIEKTKNRQEKKKSEKNQGKKKKKPRARKSEKSIKKSTQFRRFLSINNANFVKNHRKIHFFSHFLLIKMALRAAKKEMRALMRRKLGEISAAEKTKQGELALKNLSKDPIFNAAQRIAVFVSMSHEIDTAPIVAKVLKKNGVVFLPKTFSGGKLRFFGVSAAEELETALKTGEKMGILEPADWEKREEAPAASLDLVILPGVAFDTFGRRLGHGGGCYDKFLATIPAIAAEYAGNGPKNAENARKIAEIDAKTAEIGSKSAENDAKLEENDAKSGEIGEKMGENGAKTGENRPSLFALCLSEQIVSSVPTGPTDVRADRVFAGAVVA